MAKVVSFSHFSYEELRKLQLKLVEMLNEIDRFCEE